FGRNIKAKAKPDIPRVRDEILSENVLQGEQVLPHFRGKLSRVESFDFQRVKIPAQKRRRRGFERDLLLEPRDDRADLRLFRADDHVGRVFFAARFHEAEEVVPPERTAESEAGLNLVENERDV